MCVHSERGIGNSIRPPHQLSLALLSARRERENIVNLGVVAVASTTKLTATSKEHLMAQQWGQSASRAAGRKECYGGEQAHAPDNDDLVA